MKDKRLRYNPSAILLAKLSEKDDLASFDCGDEDINLFLKEDALIQQQIFLNSSILLFYEDYLAGYCSVMADSIKLNLTEKEEEELQVHFSEFPAVKIGRLGVDVNYTSRGFGELLIDLVVTMAEELNNDNGRDPSLGVRFVTLDAMPNRVDYYLKRGFVLNMDSKYQSKKRRTVSMRRDIFM